MKTKKILSLISAFALVCVSSFSALTVSAANAPKITATIEDFTNEADSTFNIVIKYEGMDDLFINETTWDDWGINAMQVELAGLPGTYKTDYTGTSARGAFDPTATGFEFDSAMVGVEGNVLKFAATWGTPGDYNYSTSGTITIPVKVLVPFAENAELAYQNCIIETTAYDATAETSTDYMYYQTDSKIAFGANPTITVAGDDEGDDEVKEFDAIVDQAVGTETYNGKYLKHIATVLTGADANKRISISYGTETQVSGRTLAQVFGASLVTDAKINAKIAIGVLTDDPDATFTFSLVSDEE